MVFFRTFDGDTHTHFRSEIDAMNLADGLASEEESCGPNGFVFVDRIEIDFPRGKDTMLDLLNGSYKADKVERIYERMAP